ncbi:uncharacterized protein Pyn_12641 [Prunus yedoensis var. nudiflora]|uniref:Uncharacterized protein n=1 Tax=Prunus yedoensis var. nudiflora TaxID=2094558 RepID=A0A314UQS3_PRUYE|nr:uncharacterized protein Pyn_12641 [Prunus yedoensis var. nudiflora]
MGVEKITKTEIDRFLDKALEDETPQGPMDVTRFIILELFISNLFCNSGCTLAWTYVTTINTVKDMKQYNWAKGCKSQKQNTCKGENDIAQQQLFTSGETVKKDAEQTKSQIHEQKQEKMNEHNMDEDIATDLNEQVV